MSNPLFKTQMGVPNEVLMQIFDHLDSRSLIKAGSVCKRWRSIVQMVHEKAWKSVTKAVKLKPKLIGPKYKKIGWVKKQHTWNMCKCINIARDLVFYEDKELLEADAELDLKQNKYDEEDWIFHKSGEITEIDELYIHDKEEAKAFIRLAAAGFIDEIVHLEFVESETFDFSTVKNLGPLLKIVTCSIQMQFVSKISKIFNHMNCGTLYIWNTSFREIYTDADIETLNEVLNDKVYMFVREGTGGNFPLIKKYDGKGKCNHIKLTYEIIDGDYEVKQKARNQFYLESKKIKKWASSRGWKVEYDKDDKEFSLWRESKPTDCVIKYEYDENDTDEYVDL